MAGKRMTSTEIWLRLINIGSLYGDAMLEIAQRLLRQATVDAEAVNAAGLSPKHAVKFFRSARVSLNVVWNGWNTPTTTFSRRMILVFRHCCVLYLIFPGRSLCEAALTYLIACSLRLLAAVRPRGTASVGGKCSVNSCPNVALRSPVAWLAASTVWHIMRRCQRKGEVSPCLAMVFLVSIRVVITFWLSNLSLLRGR